MEKIKVEVRIKPNKNNILDFTHNKINVGANTYIFSRVHNIVNQKILFSTSVAPLIEKFLSGENCSILAYGQTGSGKTYTIGISSHTENNRNNSVKYAMVQYALEAIFKANITVACTFIEIYNEEIIDLLGNSRDPLNIRQGMNDISIVGLKEVEVNLFQSSLELLDSGSEKRTTKSTKMNRESSRSHAIFTVILRQAKDNGIIESKLAFVDLAGSERLKRTECTGNRARESISINSGLLALGNVINALYLKKNHVPFRDSKLTRILEKCLVGHVFLIACISGLQDDIHETTNTLQYASRAAQITLNSKVKITNDKDKMVILNLKKQISSLRDENNKLKSLLHQKSSTNDKIRSHPFVVELIERLKAYEGNKVLNNIGIRNETDNYESLSNYKPIMSSTNQSTVTSLEENYSQMNMEYDRNILSEDLGLEIDKLDLSTSNSDSTNDSDTTVYYSNQNEDLCLPASMKTQNTIQNRNISPIKSEISLEDPKDMLDYTKKRKRVVSFDLFSRNETSNKKVNIKLVETITDTSAVSMITHLDN